MITVTSVEAQERFERVIEMAQREAVSVTQHGRTAAFVVSPQDMKDLLDSRSRRSQAVSELEAWVLATRADRSPEQAQAAEALTDEQVRQLVHEAR